MVKEVLVEWERIFQKGEDIFKDKVKYVDEDKRWILEMFDKLVKYDDKKVQKTLGEFYGFFLSFIFRIVYYY